MTRLPGLWLMVGLAAGSALTPLVAFQGPGGRLSPAVPPVARRASMKGSGGARGKCTVEVVVDGVAEIEIQGDNALLQTLQGQPASWVRFECTDALPRLPDAFKFTGIEGRGRQLLVRDPRGNRGVAVVRIEDPKSGREGYTFDLEWRGSGNAGPAAFDSASGRVADNAAEACKDAVRERAAHDYEYRNLEFGRIVADASRARGDYLTGRFIYRRGFSQEEFEFVCTMESGRVRNVELRRW